ncbi:uncharacterized protein N0V89_009063 [Didymosphaeria variabile]|uniref:Uncharacterized protein n=1 Tax=Didymosphaeria variabile TaxID=1932322 RepID=A0A9W8XHY8_9PLEO|nr:uncharacterized protein N0V89_009063 [Didymosphaeria variabile]KAJ4350442.1 hypothetical protein N0V89_009063 [Didymosphaeria variabile]
MLDSFKDSGGASSKFASEAAFLSSLVSTVKHLSDYIQTTPQDDIAEDVAKLVDVIKEPLSEFKQFLDKHEAALGKQPTKSGLGKIKSTIKYTIKDASGKIEKLRIQVEQPLQAVNSLLALQVLKCITSTPQKPLQQNQLLQIVEAIHVADVPTELQKQIDVLQHGVATQKVQNDHQLERIIDMRDSLTGQLDALQNILEETTALPSNNQSDQQANAQPEQGSSYSDSKFQDERRTSKSDHTNGNISVSELCLHTIEAKGGPIQFKVCNNNKNR